jgi:hypothetical protein
MKKIFLLLMISIFLIPVAYSANYWVTAFSSCPTTLDSQTCSGSDRVCGSSGGVTYCSAPAAIVAPAVSATSIVDQDAGVINGGYIIDCYAFDSVAPRCDNTQAFWCDRNSVCYTTQQRATICDPNVFGSAGCGSCRTGYYNCYGDVNCESTATSVCSGGSSSHNHYTSATCDNLTAGGTCVCDTNYHACDGSLTDTDGCEISDGGNCGLYLGTYTGRYAAIQCVGSAGNCTASGAASGNRDCNNDDSDNNNLTCNGANGCEIQASASCGFGTGTYQSGICLNTTNGNCTANSQRLDCDDGDADGDVNTCNDGVNGCEITNNTACTVAGLSGTYSGCSCIVNKIPFYTGNNTLYSTYGVENFLWGIDYGIGNIMQLRHNVTDANFTINQNACIVFNDSTTQCTAASGTGGSIPTDLINVTFLNSTYINTTNITFEYCFGNGTQLLDVCLSNGTNCIAGGNSSFNQSLTDRLYVPYNGSTQDIDMNNRSIRNISNVSTTGLNVNIITQNITENGGNPSYNASGIFNTKVQPTTSWNLDTTLNWSDDPSALLPQNLANFKYIDSRKLLSSNIDYLKVVNFGFDRTTDFQSASISLHYGMIYDFLMKDLGLYTGASSSIIYKGIYVHGELNPNLTTDSAINVIRYDFIDLSSDVKIGAKDYSTVGIDDAEVIFNAFTINPVLTTESSNTNIIRARGINYAPSMSAQSNITENYVVWAGNGNIALPNSVRVSGTTAQKAQWKYNGGKLQFGGGTGGTEYVEYSPNAEIFYDLNGSFRFEPVYAVSQVVFNQVGNDTNFVIGGNGENNTFYLDWGLASIGLGTSSPRARLDVNGSVIVSNNITGDYIYGNLTQGTGVCLSNGTNCVDGGNTSFNETYGNTIWYNINNPRGYYDNSTIVNAVGNFSANNFSIYANMYNVSNPFHFINLSNTTGLFFNFSYSNYLNQEVNTTSSAIFKYLNVTANMTGIGNLSISENTTTVIIRTLNNKEICIGNC